MAMEDLWLQIFLVGTKWDHFDMVYKYKWNFTNLEEALEVGGELHDKKVYLFGGTEPQLVSYNDQLEVAMIPVVVAVVSPFPPSDKIGITSIQMGTEEILPMKEMKMDWVPYIPAENRESKVERLKGSQIFILTCDQRSALRHLKPELLEKFEYCFPYFDDPLKEDEVEQSTVVDDLFLIDPELKVTDKLIEEERLPADQRERFKDNVMEKVRKAKKANREAMESREKAREEMSQQFYKFYPVPTPDTPDVSGLKFPFINRFYGKAHKVM